MAEGFNLSAIQKAANEANDFLFELSKKHFFTSQEVMEMLLHLVACNLVASASDKSAIKLFVKALEKACKDYWKRDFAKIQEQRKKEATTDG